MNSTLPRITVQSFQGERLQLIAEAQSQLGYRNTYGKLMSTLNQLSLPPFRTSAVEAYKKEHEKNGIYSGTQNWIVWEVVNVIGLGLAIWGCLHTWVSPAPKALSITALSLAAVSTVISVVLASETIGYGKRTVWSWTATRLRDYQEPIPDHVLYKALTLNKALPDVDFNVVYLESSTQERHPDPFLQVCLGTEVYYLEQWDEKDLPRMDV